MDTILNKTQKSTIKKSIEDIEIESLDKKRKESRPKKNKKKKQQQQQQKTTTITNKTLKDKVEYAELTKYVNKET